MDKRPNVSVIVPIYNVEKYLDRCMHSLVNQTLKDIEIILIDDGSIDNCPQMCDKYASQDSRIKVIHKKMQVLVMRVILGLKSQLVNMLHFLIAMILLMKECMKYYMIRQKIII